ncbi:MAG: agmatine deiminase family protein [Deltaproteobacteria bacterium]|nr:agmatine deiminase family protein [Deltaproteobacteria bacterium]
MKLERTRLLIGGVGLSLLAACDDRPLDAAPTLDPVDDVVPFEARFDHQGNFIPDPRVLPAWRSGKTYAAQKGDQYDDTRAEAPQHFAITEPPARVGFRAMAEWEPMRALAMTFPGYMLSSTNATQTVVQIAKVGSDYGEIWILVDGSQAENGLKTRLASAGLPSSAIGTKVKFMRTPLDSIWFIDSGPLPLIDPVEGSYAFTDFRYYHERPLDDGIPTLLARSLEHFGRPAPVTAYRMPLTTEGGTFQATTDGVCITSSRQIWNMTCYTGNCQDSVLEDDLEDLQSHPQAVIMRQTLATYAGCQDLIVTHSITDDGTGHIDMYLKILDDDRILLGEYDHASTNAYERQNADLLDDNAAFLEAYVKPDGGGFTVHRLPMPGHRSSAGFGSVPFTYINSTFFNRVNLWPATNYSNWVASRDAAQAVWDEVLPGYDNIWIDSTELSFYSGAIHCITRTIPELAEAAWVADGTCDSGTCVAPEHGYDDSCQPEGVDEQLCWGPEWLCGCNDCESGCVGSVDECQGIAYQGCCEEGNVIYCEGGQLMRVQCGGLGCGWNAWGGYYDCEQTGGDPTGTYPVTCGECEPQCDGKSCGDDGCGGVCGTCDAGVPCLDGACRSDCADCDPGEIGCDGTVAWMCMAGAGGCHAKQTFDCASQGLFCTAGDCVADPVEPGPESAPEQSPEAATEGAPEPGPEPSPEVAVEESDEDVAPTTPTDASTAGDGALESGGGGPTGRSADDGCGGGSAGGPAGLVAALGFALWASRRRRGASVA